MALDLKIRKNNLNCGEYFVLGEPASGKTRLIIARFLLYQYREMVLRASFHHRGPEIKVLEDYRQEIIEG